MRFEFNDDQRAFLDALARIADDHRAPEGLGTATCVHSPALAQALVGAGLFEALVVPELGRVAAAALVIELAGLPQAVEAAAAALLLPLLRADLPPSLGDAAAERPWAVAWDRQDQPLRWLPQACRVLRVVGDAVAVAAVTEDDVLTGDSPFGYPVGRLRSPEALAWQALPRLDARQLRTQGRIGLAAEITGCLHAGLQCVLQHVKDRRQFGRPLGSFQTVQHRLAECAVLIEGLRWLTLKAAHGGAAADALLAAAQAQQAVSRVSYDLHQFMGAMGLTLEHPLHRFTSRAKMLRADQGGAERQFEALAVATWGPARATAF